MRILKLILTNHNNNKKKTWVNKIINAPNQKSSVYIDL